MDTCVFLHVLDVFRGLWEHIPRFTYGVFTLPMVLLTVGIGICFVLLWVDLPCTTRVLGTRTTSFLQGFFLAPLLVVTGIAAAFYLDFGNFRYGSFLNAYEFYHYYLGSKYARELGYGNLYNATIIADVEGGEKRSRPGKQVRDLNTGLHVDMQTVLARAEEIKANFSPRRWESFVEDVRWFEKKLAVSRWDAMLKDKGYNATPAWSALVGGLLTNVVPTSSTVGMNFLASIDLILIATAALLVTWAFGPRAALLMLLLIGASYMMRFSHMKGALLRTDFAMSAVAAICFLKKGYFRTAGVLLAYSAMSRIFPAVFAFGVGARMVWDVLGLLSLQEYTRSRFANYLLNALTLPWRMVRNIPRQYVQFFVAYGTTVVLLVLASLVYAEGPRIWAEYKEKIGRHSQDISPWRVGYKYVFIGKAGLPKTTPPSLQQPDIPAWQKALDYFKSLKPYTQSRIYRERPFEWACIMAAVLLLSFLCIRGMATYEATAFSFVPLFFLVSPTYYYYIMLAVPLLFFTSALHKPSRAFGAMLLLGSGIPGHWFYKMWAQEFPTYYWHSVYLLIFVALYMLLLGCWETWRYMRRPPALRVEWAPPLQLEYKPVPLLGYEAERRTPTTSSP